MAAMVQAMPPPCFPDEVAILSAAARAQAEDSSLLKLLKMDASDVDDEFARIVSTEAPDSENSPEEGDLEASPDASFIGGDLGLGDAAIRPAPGLGVCDTASPLPAEWVGVYTVMMRNLPNKFTQELLRAELDAAGFWGLYDFLYLPIDMETKANKGYAFLNFVDAAYSWVFRATFEGRKLGRFNSNKVVTITPAALQGFEANYAHYSSSRVSRGDPAARPLFLRQPTPTAKQPAGSTSRGKGRVRRSRNSLIDVAAKEQQMLQQALAPAPPLWPTSGGDFAAWPPPLAASCLGALDFMQAAPSPMPRRSAAGYEGLETNEPQKIANFCHACGAKMLGQHAAFCCSCGTARITI